MSLMYYCFLLIKEFGAKYVVVYFGDHMKNIDKRNDFFYDYGKKVEEYGIKIGIENTIYGLTSNPKTLRDICSGAEVDCIFDIDHANSINKLDEYLLKVGNIVSHIHFFQS